ncbi:unnamed protein product, partial [Anisakis simplex]|uniref:WD_REPEATS_REGION domain-containing protein n=1 Tax=Anisakis simplex TaxID=6269 RepID=A0A0M3JK86_ANISI
MASHIYGYISDMKTHKRFAQLHSIHRVDISRWVPTPSRCSFASIRISGDLGLLINHLNLLFSNMLRAEASVRPADVILSRPKQHRGSVYCLAFNPIGELLATGSNDKSLRLMAFNNELCKIGSLFISFVHFFFVFEHFVQKVFTIVLFR